MTTVTIEYNETVLQDLWFIKIMVIKRHKIAKHVSTQHWVHITILYFLEF